MENQKGYEIINVAGRLAQRFLRNPLTVVLGAMLLLVGYLALSIMPREEDPQIAISGGAVIVAMPGATPKEIENIIVKPVIKRISRLPVLQLPIPGYNPA